LKMEKKSRKMTPELLIKTYMKLGSAEKTARKLGVGVSYVKTKLWLLRKAGLPIPKEKAVARKTFEEAVKRNFNGLRSLVIQLSK